MNDKARAVDNGGKVEATPRVGDDKRVDGNIVNLEIVREVSLINPAYPRERSTDMDGMDEITFGGEVVGPSGDELRVLDGPTNESGVIGPQGLDKQHTRTRFTQMDYGPVELLKEGTKSIMGKRINQGQQHVSLGSIDEHAGE